MGANAELRQNGTVIRFDESILNAMEPRLFDVDWLRANGHHEGTAKGRSQAHFLTFANRHMVLRKFLRGGLVGKFNRDLYLRTGKDKSRAMREFDLLSWMHNRGLPIPRPVAAQYQPSGLFYRAHLITERISNARPLEDVLREVELPATTWSAVGTTIKQLHDHDVFHSDLNCRNILIDKDQSVWLIDFDKCERREPGDWKTQNLDRLLRSLRKENGIATGLHWDETAWSHLLSGYAGEGASNSDGITRSPSI